MNSEQLIHYRGQLQTELFNILTFWETTAIDPKSKQFYGEISGNGTPFEEAPKGIIMYSRIMWAFSAAAQFYKNPEYIKTADIAKSFIESHFFDAKHDGYFWEVNHTGTPTITKKQVYAQAFVIYAYAEYYRATSDHDALTRAMSLFYCIENHCCDKQYGGYFEAFSDSWEKLDDVRLSERDLNEPKGMNTNLHVLEAYTCLYMASKNPVVLSSLEKLIDVFTNKIIDSKHHVTIFFSEDWQPQTHEISYGHDIESSWLLWEAICITQNEELKKTYKQFIINMVDTFLKKGYDTTNNCVLYEYNTLTKHLDSDRHWWVQVEAMEGLANAYAMTQDESYLQTAFKIWDYVYTHIIDTQKGEWFWRVSEKNIPYTDDQKAGPWKGPYHNTRALMRIITKINSVLS